MINLGQTFGRQPRRSSYETETRSSLADRLDRYVGNVAQPDAKLTARDRLEYRARVESALSRS